MVPDVLFILLFIIYYTIYCYYSTTQLVKSYYISIWFSKLLKEIVFLDFKKMFKFTVSASQNKDERWNYFTIFDQGILKKNRNISSNLCGQNTLKLQLQLLTII